jgi:hypothetical protein
MANVSATMDAVPLDRRLLNLEDSEGNVVSIAVGPEVRNLPQAKIGGQVSSTASRIE